MTQPSDGLAGKPAETTEGSPLSTVTARQSSAGMYTPRSSATVPAMTDDDSRSEPDDPDSWHKPPAREDLVPPALMWILTLLFAVIVVVAIDVLLSVWPEPSASGAVQSAATVSAVKILWGQGTVTINASDRMMLITILMGVIGAMVHTMTSFADFVGNRRLVWSWLPWYFLRPLIGSGLALFFYIGFRAGLLTTSSGGATDFNPFGVAALGGLAGMFSKQATDKLNEVFSTMFKTSGTTGDAKRSGKLGSNAPTKPTGATSTT
jgi:hypothetical protein